MNAVSRVSAVGLTALAMLGWLVAAPQAVAESHALILTISHYQNNIPQLAGVQKDGENAREIAKAMGVPDKNILELDDRSLTLQGMRQAFDDLAERVKPGDDVFIYYSGHGGRQPDPEAPSRCAESLISVDGQHFMDFELEAKLKRISSKADKVVALIDACHSGGVTTRSAHVGAAAPFAPKYWRGGTADACYTPVNRVTRGIALATRSAGSGAQNFVYIAAAQANEVSLDQPGRGGVATLAWLACIEGKAKDSDHSGGLTAEEIRQCAQARINDMLKDVEGYTPHHVVVTGNSGLVLALPGNATAGNADPISPRSTLLDIYNRRDDRRVVEIKPSKPAFKIEQDKVEFTVTSDHDGYLYLLMAGSDGKTFDMLFPNKLDRNNVVRAGEPVRLPRPAWELQSMGPAGRSALLAIVADSPRDFDKVGLEAAGPFSMVGASQASAKDIVLATASAPAAESDECTQGMALRNLVVAKRCSKAYGSGFVEIEEVK